MWSYLYIHNERSISIYKYSKSGGQQIIKSWPCLILPFWTTTMPHKTLCFFRARVGYSEMPMCRAYGDVVAAALASQMEATTVRGARQLEGQTCYVFEEENGYIFSYWKNSWVFWCLWFSILNSSGRKWWWIMFWLSLRNVNLVRICSLEPFHPVSAGVVGGQKWKYGVCVFAAYQTHCIDLDFLKNYWDHRWLAWLLWNLLSFVGHLKPQYQTQTQFASS